MNVSQLKPLWFLLSSDRVSMKALIFIIDNMLRPLSDDDDDFLLQPAEEIQFVWCELLSEALSALWTNSVTSDPDCWLRWDPLNPEARPTPKLRQGADNMVRVINIHHRC